MNKEIFGTIVRSMIGAGLIYAIYYLLNSNGPMIWNIIGSILILIFGGIFIIEFIMLVIAGPIFYFTRHK